MDEPANLERLARVGRLAGEQLVRDSDFPPAFDLAG